MAISIRDECLELQKLYAGRQGQISSDYNLLAQVDELKQDHMESFVTNDPRTTWNMGTYLLQPKPLVHRISRTDEQALTPEGTSAALTIQNMFERVWRRRNRRHQRRGGNTFFWDLLGTMSFTGWWAVPYEMRTDRFFVDFWQPSTVYPAFSDDEEVGVDRLARITKFDYQTAITRANREGWDISKVRRTTGDNPSLTEYMLYKIIDGQVNLGIQFENDVVRPLSPVGLVEIPILTGAVGGLPLSNSAMATIIGSGPYQGAVDFNSRTIKGQGILATNAQVIRQYNRQQSFIQQILHDIANPKTWEKNLGQKIIENVEDLFKRGAHFRMNVQEDIGTLGSPGIPPEIQTLLFTLRNQMQRGGFSDITFGNAVQEGTSIMMSQAAEASQQVLYPYHVGSQFIFSEIAQRWFTKLLERPKAYNRVITPLEISALQQLKQEGELEVEATYAILIPGDLSRRVNLARFASPEFKLSPDTAFELFLPEVTNVRAEMAKSVSAEARLHPTMKEVNLIGALHAAAKELVDIDPALAKVYQQTAAQLQASLSGGPQAPPTAGPPGIGPGVIPASVQEQLGGSANGAAAQPR